MKRCKVCGSYAFNLYKEDIDQGDLCDVHYWKEKALMSDTDVAQPEQCTGCEGKPSGSNNPCAVCGNSQPVVAEQHKQEPVAWVPYLSDRADGVKGHYAIARWNPRGYREVWNLRRHEWGAYSDDVLSLEEADTLLRLITIPTRKVTSPQPPQRKPLTDEQILEANTFKCGKATCVHVQVDGEPENIIGLARAIEAAHGITKEDK